MRKNYRICYGSENQDIEAGTLVASLMSVNTALNDINRYLNSIQGTERKISIRVNGTASGSFNLDITIIQSLGEALGAIWAASGGIDNLIDMLANMIQIVVFLKSRAPRRVEKRGSEVLIENYNNECMTIQIEQMNVYMQCPGARQAIAKNHELLSDDPEVKDFALQAGGRELISLKQEAMAEATCAPELIDDDKVRAVTEEAWIKAIRLSYNPAHKWTFVHRGIQIGARIEDEAFWTRVDDNEKFSKGDSFLVMLRIKQVRDIGLNAWLNKEYSVVEVLRHQSEDPEEMIPGI